MPLTRDAIVKRAARELRDGYYVNLGIGIPTLVANHITACMDIVLHSEKGLLGMGPCPTDAEVDPDQLEYLIYGLLRLDAQLAVEVEDGRRPPAPSEGREFHQVLMRDLLHALAMEGTGRAAFVDQLRCCWPGAAEAS